MRINVGLVRVLARHVAVAVGVGGARRQHEAGLARPRGARPARAVAVIEAGLAVEGAVRRVARDPARVPGQAPGAGRAHAVLAARVPGAAPGAVPARHGARRVAPHARRQRGVGREPPAVGRRAVLAPALARRPVLAVGAGLALRRAHARKIAGAARHAQPARAPRVVRTQHARQPFQPAPVGADTGPRRIHHSGGLAHARALVQLVRLLQRPAPLAVHPVAPDPAQRARPAVAQLRARVEARQVLPDLALLVRPNPPVSGQLPRVQAGVERVRAHGVARVGAGRHRRGPALGAVGAVPVVRRVASGESVLPGPAR